jgi:hypothetical protein
VDAQQRWEPQNGVKLEGAEALVVLAIGGIAAYFIYKTLNKAACTACQISQAILHPNCVVANSFTAADNWLKCELGVNCCQIGANPSGQ